MIVADPECLVTAPESGGTPAQVNELYAALAAVQAELPEISKNRTAEVLKDGRRLYTYAYADLADVSAAILPVLGRHGLAFICLPGHHYHPDRKFGLRYYLLHKNGARFEGFWEISLEGGIQQIGGRITYARRYILCALTGVAADEDTDANEDTHARNQRTQNASPALPASPRAGRPRTPVHAAAAGASGSQGAGEAQTAPAPPDVGADGAGAAPDDSDFDVPGTASEPMLKAISTVLERVYGFTRDDKDKARAVCARIVAHALETSDSLSENEAKDILKRLGEWQATARKRGIEPRKFLDTVMADAAGEARDGE